MKRLRGVAERRGSLPKIVPWFQANSGRKGGGRRAEGGRKKGEPPGLSRRFGGTGAGCHCWLAQQCSEGTV
ncbi:MAG: hypothetical protein ACLQLG_12075, partial [Thermoguttaceae bacterium]